MTTPISLNYWSSHGLTGRSSSNAPVLEMGCGDCGEGGRGREGREGEGGRERKRREEEEGDVFPFFLTDLLKLGWYIRVFQIRCG